MPDLILQENHEINGDNTIANLTAGMTADFRVKVTVMLHENHSRPNLSLQLLDADNNELARSFIINVIDQQTDFTLHVRQSQLKYPLVLRCESFLEDDVPIDFKEIFLES
jgi:hypothetical protein